MTVHHMTAKRFVRLFKSGKSIRDIEIWDVSGMSYLVIEDAMRNELIRQERKRKDKK